MHTQNFRPDNDTEPKSCQADGTQSSSNEGENNFMKLQYQKDRSEKNSFHWKKNPTENMIEEFEFRDQKPEFTTEQCIIPNKLDFQTILHETHQITRTFQTIWKASHYTSLQEVNFTKNSLSTKAIQVLCNDNTFKGLKSINLDENPIGNDGIKFIADTSHWNELQTLSLQATHLGSEGTKWLALNESWMTLQLLNLSQNPHIGNRGAMNLSLNRTWSKLKYLSLSECNIDPLGINFLKRNKCWKGLKTDNIIIDEEERQKALDISTFSTLNPSKSYKHLFSALKVDEFYGAHKYTRGGGQNNYVNHEHSELFSKLSKYQERILNDSHFERELQLYVETRTKIISADEIISNPHSNEDVSESMEHALASIELAFDINKTLFENNGTNSPKVLLLPGQAGIGKSFFCRYFQRELLSSWRKPESQEADDRNLFPVYVELSTLKNPNSEAISETLARELSLTEEEILLLKTSNLSNLQLVFLFDGYDQIQNLHDLSVDRGLYKNNFCVSNKIESWRNAKVIITCREENLQEIKRRDLLFSPIEESTNNTSELKPIPGSFFQRRIEPFSNEQISCYLIKYCCFRQIEAVEGGEDEEQSPSSMKVPSILIKHSGIKSWKLVKKFEKMIDDSKLRSFARIPSMLWIMTIASHNVSSHSLQGFFKADFDQPKITTRFFIDYFVSKILTSIIVRNLVQSNNCSSSGEAINESEVASHVLQLKLQAQKLALRLSGYSIESAATTRMEKNNELSWLESSPLIQQNSSQSRLTFRCPLLQDFFLAKIIEETTIEAVTSTQQKISEELPLNQKYLTGSSAYSVIFKLLTEAIGYEKLKADHFIQLIHLLLQNDEMKRNDPDKMQDESNSKWQSPFTVALTNAITLLNLLEYDFEDQDFSNICIPGANLSHGTFNGAKFINANLQGVNFTNAFLKDAKFINANLSHVELDEPTTLKLNNESVARLAYSPDGKHLAVDIGKETVIFTNCDANKFRYKELRRIPGYFENKEGSPFSFTGERIMTIVGNISESSLCVWNVVTGEQVQKIRAPLGYNRSVIINSDPSLKEFIAYSEEEIHQYNFNQAKWIHTNIKTKNHVANSDFNPNALKILLLTDNENAVHLYNFTTGKLIQKQRHQAVISKFSSNGKQIAAATSESIQILDYIRKQAIKFLKHRGSRYWSSEIVDCAFTTNDTQIFSTKSNEIVLQEVLGEKARDVVLTRDQLDYSKNYSLNVNRMQLAEIANYNAINFKSFEVLKEYFPQIAFSIKGANCEGLNLKGTIVSGCAGVSEENFVLLKEKGDYGQFNEKMLRKLFPSNKEDAISVREVILAADNLAPIHAKIVGNDIQWVNLTILDLSRNTIEEEGGETIASNNSWPRLEELNLNETGIGNKTAIAIANNPTWKVLKNLQLASNKIGNEGAVAIGKSKLWINLEILDLHQNNIGNEGAITISANTTWKSLLMLDLSSNEIDSKRPFVRLCANTTWTNLKVFKIDENPFEVDERTLISCFEEIISKSLEELNLPEAKFGRELMQCLKYSIATEVVEISLEDKGLTDLSAVVVGGNATWIGLKKINLSKNDISDDGANRIGRNSAWVNLEEINLSFNNVGSRGGIGLGRNKAWNKLRVLNLEGNKIGNEGACAIGGNAAWAGLQSVYLGSNAIEAEGAAGLSRNSTWVDLRELDLSGNKIGSEGAARLGENTSWKNLRSLRLARNLITANGAAGLGKNSAWKNLEMLDLFCNSIESAGATKLAKNSSWTSLRTLILQDNSIDAGGAAAISQNKTWGNLETLNLARNLLEDAGVAELSKNTFWTKLQTLNLRDNMVGADGAAELSRNQVWINLQELDLADNSIDAEAAEALCRNESWTNLQVLNLEMNKIGSKGAGALGKNVTWINLRTLNLQCNSIGPEGASELAKNTAWVNLETLNLSNNSIQAKGASELSSNSSWVNLKTLDLYKNEIYQSGAAGLAKNNSWINLQALNLEHNSIGALGASGLSMNTTWVNLEKLNLEMNMVGDEGVSELGKNTAWANLQTLNLTDNMISVKGARELLGKLAWKNLQTLDLRFNSLDAETSEKLKQTINWAQLNIKWT